MTAVRKAIFLQPERTRISYVFVFYFLTLLASILIIGSSSSVLSAISAEICQGQVADTTDTCKESEKVVSFPARHMHAADAYFEFKII